jgi:hypothetical protein
LRNSDLARPLVNRFLPDYAFMGAVFIARKPSIDSDPASKTYTTYDFANNADRDRAVAEIRSVTSNGSFISRSLLMISNNGLSKKFETITGEDGLTFGVKDFTSGGVFPLLQLIDQQNPEAIETAFGPFTPNVLDRKFLDANTSSHDDHGLIAIREFRKGLDQILTDRAWHGAQLQRYRMESVEPALAAFNKREFQTEFSLAAMIGVANSFGPGSEGSGKGMIGRLDTAKALVGSNDEGQIMRAFVRAYAVRDAGNESQRAAAERLVKIGFGDASGNLPSQDELAHSGRRMLLLFQIFPLKEQRPFTDLGNFVLAADEGSQ